MSKVRVKIFSGKRSSVEARINAYLFNRNPKDLLDSKLLPLNSVTDPNDNNPVVMVMLTVKVKD